MKQMRRTVNVISCLCLLSCFLLLSFAGVAQVSAADKPVVKLRYGSYTTKLTIDDLAVWFLDEVSKRSGVEIKVDYYYSGTLAKAPDCLNAISTGVYDVGWVSSAYTPGKTPYSMMTNSACIVAKNVYSLLTANNEFVQTFKPAQDEFKKANMKYLFSSGAWHYCWIGTKAIKTLEDVKGKKGRTFGYQAKAWSALGGVPVSISAAESYDALQKGLVDGILMTPNLSHGAFRFSEVGKQFTRLDFGCLPVPFLINLDTWNKLPEVVKQAMVEVSKETPKKGVDLIAGPELGAIEKMRKAGVAIYTLPDEDHKRLDKLGATIMDQLVEDLTKKGVKDARQAMDLYLKLLDKYFAQE